MKLLIWLSFALATISAMAADSVDGDLTPIYPVTCNAITDLNKSGYSLYNYNFAIINGEFKADFDFAYLLCKQNGENSVIWQKIPTNYTFRSQIRNGDGTVDQLSKRFVESHIQLTSRNSILLGRYSLNMTALEQRISTSSSLEQILGAQGLDELEKTGKTAFRVDFNFRAKTIYSINGGPEKNLGVKNGGLYLSRGFFLRKNGNSFSLETIK